MMRINGAAMSSAMFNPRFLFVKRGPAFEGGGIHVCLCVDAAVGLMGTIL